ncbi:MAG: hypothetical protein JKY09_00645 [Crocinitomicaceae bacterium]|nr:hypothetical protein [Crocinitomicaceae bacterium]
MKGLAYSTGAFFTSTTLIAILFKVMHWPGAGIGLVVGVAGLSLIAIPLIAIHNYRSVT